MVTYTRIWAHAAACTPILEFLKMAKVLMVSFCPILSCKDSFSSKNFVVFRKKKLGRVGVKGIVQKCPFLIFFLFFFDKNELGAIFFLFRSP